MNYLQLMEAKLILKMSFPLVVEWTLSRGNNPGVFPILIKPQLTNVQMKP